MAVLMGEETGTSVRSNRQSDLAIVRSSGRTLECLQEDVCCPSVLPYPLTFGLLFYLSISIQVPSVLLFWEVLREERQPISHLPV